MKIKGTYQGNNEILVSASYGVGESVHQTNFILVDEYTEVDGKKVLSVKANEPKVGSIVEIDVDSNGRDEVTVSQRAAYDAKKSVQDEIPPPQEPFGEFKPPRKIK